MDPLAFNVSHCSGGQGEGTISTGGTVTGHRGGLETPNLVKINSPPEMVQYSVVAATRAELSHSQAAVS
jgi:hypothetical protein